MGPLPVCYGVLLRVFVCALWMLRPCCSLSRPLLQLSRDCKVEVQRILHQRALDVRLDPELQRRCMSDLGKWCSEKTEAGQELECLQDHLEDLVLDCREMVGNLTELESEVRRAAGCSRAADRKQRVCLLFFRTFRSRRCS